MNRISIQDLKATLSAAVADAEAGQTVVITRHNRAVAQLTPATRTHTHGPTVTSRAAIRPLLRAATKGRYLQVLLEDRAADR